MQGSFVVKTHSFEGPLDVLVSMIEKRKMHISDVSLAQVTDDFISYTESLSDTSSGMIAHFVLVASTLMLIKSRALLPQISLSQEESESIDELELKLKLLQYIRELSTKSITPKWNASPLFAREHKAADKEVVFAPPTRTPVTTESLHAGLLSALTSLPVQETIPQATVKKVISLEETMSTLLERVQQGLNMGLREFAGVKHTGKRLPRAVKENVIVSFLAVLELARRGALEIEQGERFGDIHLQTLEVDTPRYV